MGTVSFCNDCVESFAGYYVDPYYWGLRTYNYTAGFASLSDDTYDIGFYHTGCTYVTEKCASPTLSYFSSVYHISDEYYHGVNLKSYPLFTFGSILPALRCRNTMQDCHIQVTNVLMSS